MKNKKILNKIKKKVNSNLVGDIYGHEWYAKWRKMFLYFFEQIENNKEINLDLQLPDLWSFIEKTKEILLFKALDSDARGCIRDLLVFLYNVNANSKKDESLEHDIMLCIKICDLCLTLNELIGVAREVIGKIQSTLLYAPPAFKVAEHYLKILLNEIEEDNE